MLEVARFLATVDSEAFRRAAVSRAYYAAFWHCRTAVESRFGPIDTPGAEIHAEVANLMAVWDGDGALRLGQLRRNRNLADYDSLRTVERGLTARSLQIAAALLTSA